jgi:Holliday junction resolvase RusA-like endonuclease
MTEHPHPPVLRIALPGVVSWSRPRMERGGVRYPAAYARDRDAWGLLVAQAVRDARWRPPPEARYRVAVTVYGGGKRDLDRVCTAALDALQAGDALRDDCLVDELRAVRHRLHRIGRPSTVVDLFVIPGVRRARERDSDAAVSPTPRGAAPRRAS